MCLVSIDVQDGGFNVQDIVEMCFWMRSCEMQHLALKLAKFISTDLMNLANV